MLKLEANEICPFGDVCGHRDDYEFFGKCEGVNPLRDNDFICELFEEYNYSDQNRASNTGICKVS